MTILKISIITATYNSADTIADCIKSVNNQTYQDIEHIIIDGASTDNTLKIIKSTPNRISKIISEHDNGIYDALNKGIKMSTGDIIGFLHSDDLFSTNHIIEKIVSLFNNINISGVYGDQVIIDKTKSTKIIRNCKSKAFQLKLLYKGWMPSHSTLFLRKEVYVVHGFFDLSFKVSADYDYMLRIFRDEKLEFYYLPELISKMRAGGASNGSLKKIIYNTKEDFIALKKNKIPHPIKALMFKKISKLFEYLK